MSQRRAYRTTGKHRRVIESVETCKSFVCSAVHVFHKNGCLHRPTRSSPFLSLEPLPKLTSLLYLRICASKQLSGWSPLAFRREYFPYTVLVNCAETSLFNRVIYDRPVTYRADVADAHPLSANLILVKLSEGTCQSHSRFIMLRCSLGTAVQIRSLSTI